MSSGITIDLFTDSESDDGFKGQSVDLYTSGAGEMTDANGDFSAMDDQSVGSFSGGSGGVWVVVVLITIMLVKRSQGKKYAINELNR